MPTSRDRTGLSPDKTPDWRPDQLRLKPGERILTAIPSSGGVGRVDVGIEISTGVGDKRLPVLNPSARMHGRSVMDFGSNRLYAGGCTCVTVDEPVGIIGGPPAARRFSGKVWELTCTTAGTIQAVFPISTEMLWAMGANNGTSAADLKEQIVWWVEVVDRSKFHASNSQINFQFADEATYAAATYDLTLTRTLAANNGIQCYPSRRADYTGDPLKWPALKLGRVTISNCTVGAQIRLWACLAGGGGKPKIAPLHDGFWQSQVLYAVPELNRRGIQCSFSAMYSAFGQLSGGVQRANEAEIKEVISMGHRMLQHTFRPTSDFATAADAFARVDLNRQQLEAAGFGDQDLDTVIYSGGSYAWSANGRELADYLREQGYVGACISSGGGHPPSLGYRRFMHPRYPIQGPLTTTDIDNMLIEHESLAGSGYSIIPLLHHVVPTLDANPDVAASQLTVYNYQRLLDGWVSLARAGKIEFETVRNTLLTNA